MSRSSPKSFRLSPAALAFPDPEVRLAAIDGGLDPAALFGRDAPLEVEVGPGKGRVLLALAELRPEVDFLAIERAAPYARLVKLRLRRALLGNVRVLCADAHDVLARLLPEGSVRQIHVLFPDPWPKRRHHKRRLLTPAFLAAVARALAPGGRLNVATDHDGYAAWIAGAAAAPAVARLLEPTPELALPAAIVEATSFARRGRALGHDLHLRAWRRR